MSASVPRARAELASVREDLEELTAIASRVAIASRDGAPVDHQTAVELVAHVPCAVEALETVEACLADS